MTAGHSAASAAPALTGRRRLGELPRLTVSRWVSGAAGVIGALALVGWILGVEILTRGVPGIATMKFNTAVCIVLLASTFFIRRRLVGWLCGLVAVVAVASAVEWLATLDFGIDNPLGLDHVVSDQPGRMSLSSACCLVLLALSIAGTARRPRSAQVAATVVLAVSLLTFLGYLFGVPSLSSIGPFSVVALHTAIAYAMLSFAAMISVRGSALWWLMTGRDAGVSTLRQLLPWTLFALPVLAALRQWGQRAGLYDTNFGIALLTSVSVLVLTVVMWKAARRLAVVDRDRAAALDALRELTGELEERVSTRTAQLEGERELLRVAEIAARNAQVDAERANSAKTEFLSRMSHELRTPLNAVLGFAQLLELEQLTGVQAEAVGHIRRGGSHLLELVNDVLDITGIEAEQLTVNLEPLLIAPVLTDSIGLCRPLAERSGIRIRFHPGDLGTVVVCADRRRLQQIITNLLTNATKYNQLNGTIDVTLAAVGQTHVGVSVADTGPGIATEDLPRLFQPFDRLSYQSSAIEGTGIGLMLVQRLTTLMNGRLDVVSEVGIGSTFTLQLPVVTSAAIQVEEPADSAAAVR